MQVVGLVRVLDAAEHIRHRSVLLGARLGMDGISEFLRLIQSQGLAKGRLRGVFHLAIGRRITTRDGRLIVNGVTWRDLAAALKQVRFDKELVRELGVDPDTLAPRDRQRMWYLAISHAQVDGAEARAQAAKLQNDLERLNIIVGPPPGAETGRSTSTSERASPSAVTSGITEPAAAESEETPPPAADSPRRRPGKKK